MCIISRRLPPSEEEGKKKKKLSKFLFGGLDRLCTPAPTRLRPDDELAGLWELRLRVSAVCWPCERAHRRRICQESTDREEEEAEIVHKEKK